MCTAAYREALTRDFSSPAPSQGHVTEAEADCEGAADPPLRRRMKLRQNGLESRGAAAAVVEAKSGPAMTVGLKGRGWRTRPERRS
jgi:hypothetical protein